MLILYKTMDISTSEIDVLGAIFFLDTATRKDIARFAGLSTVSVTSVLSRLVEKGLVAASGKATSGGRPSAIYRIEGGFGCTLGVYVGSDRSRITAVNAAGEILDERGFTLSLSSLAGEHIKEIVEQVSLEARRFLDSERLQGQRMFAAGVAVPGMVDTERGIWLRGLQFSGVEHVEIGAALRNTLNMPVILEDPARCSAQLALSRIGPAAAGELVFLYLGSGVGAGIIVGGELYRGSRGLAGEVGHFIVDQGGARCSCGNVGCLETVVSVPAILQRFRRRLSEGVISSLQRTAPAALTLEHIRDAAQAGDRLAQSTLFEIGFFLGDACARLIQIYNPRTLIIGGPAGILGEFFREAALQTIRQQVIPEMLVDLHLEFNASESGDEALGSALIAQRWAWQHIGQLIRG
jgi:N-acetylglucosamine repressor